MKSILLFSLLLVTASVCPVSAQDTIPRPPAASPQQRQIIERLKRSGLSKEQVRQRLQAAGYDPNLADQYFDEMSRADTTTLGATSKYTRPLPPPSSSLLAALRRIGVLTPEDSLIEQNIRADTIKKPKPLPKSTEPQIFGRELFAATTQFETTMGGPVDPGYKLGPGDELTLIVTGDVELAYDLTVTREGYIVIPNVGQVIVNGLTLDETRRRLNERLARVYSGVSVGSTQADITVGKLRSKLVYVIGEAEVPGAYSLSGSATVFNALYRAGGPAVNGSFRNIEVRRDNRVVRKVDIYDYLLRGEKGSDIRLEQGDVVFIPVVGPQVTVVGSVRRPAIYELSISESLTDVLRFAGGPEADAAVERIQVDRILPVGQRRPGQERVLVDVKIEDLARGLRVAMNDGDRVRVSKISEMRRNRVAVNGDVVRPGEYEFRRGMTAQNLVDAAQGLLSTAYRPVAQIVRLNPADSSTSIMRVVLDDAASPDYATKIVLEDLDELNVFGRAKLANPQRVEVFGYVKNEGTYNFSQGMTVQDIILMAGGFTEGAAEGTVEVARRVATTTGQDSIATVFRVPLNMNISDTRVLGTTPFKLAEGDQVFVRRTPGFQPLSTVEVSGEVTYPGAYTLASRQDRVTDLVARAGGLTRDAYAIGFRLYRDGKPVGVDLPAAIKRPHGPDDITLEPGDRIEIPRYDPTVLVTGEVAFESRVRYEPGLSVGDYLNRAGGVTEKGNAGRVAVRYPNGAVRTSSRFLGFRNSPKVLPGSTITVPEKTANTGFNWDATVGRAMSFLTGLATIILTIRAVN